MTTFRTVLGLAAALFLLTFTSCEEIPPNIDLTSEGGESNETIDPGVQERSVLIEEFTGVTCVNCPAGALEIQTLVETYPGQIVPVAIHTGSFAVPFPDDPKSDLGGSDADAIGNFLGTPLGYPSAVINRKKFEGENSLQVNKSNWAGFVANEVAVDPIVRIGIRSMPDPSTQDLMVLTSVHIDEDIMGKLRLTIMLVEDGIIAKQATSSGVEDNYEHKHVLRKVLTPINGYALGDAHLEGDILNNSFTLAWNDDWVYDNCHLVAFVSRADADTKEVLQATEGVLLP